MSVTVNDSEGGIGKYVHVVLKRDLPNNLFIVYELQQKRRNMKKRD